MYSACIEWLFAREAAAPADRIRLARAAGLSAVEFWSWRDKDIDALKAALDQYAISLTGFVSEPMAPLTDPAAHETFLHGLEESVSIAQRLGARNLIAQAGNERTDIPRAAQRDSIETCLTKAADILAGTGVTLLLEPLNTRIDHPGYYLHSTAEGLAIIAAVARPEIRLLYDIYHAAVMDERPETILNGSIELIGHVHLADAPGRGEPGSGTMDWQARVSWLRQAGYDGAIGLEYRPSGSTLQSLQPLLAAAAGDALTPGSAPRHPT